MKIRELLPLCTLHGRTVYDEEREALFCNWSLSGLSIGVKGTYLKAKVFADCDQIPGMPGMPQPPADWPCVGCAKGDELFYRHECRENIEELVLWQGEAEEEIELRIVKVSENARGKLAILELETDGAFFKAVDRRPRMEIVGDSITCGFGNEAPDNAFEFHTGEENGWMTYGAIAARELGYDLSMVCESGIAATKPEHPLFPMHAMEDIYGKRDEMYALKYGKENVDWDFENEPNQIVVINLGTNDTTPIRFIRDFSEVDKMAEWFHARYKEFVKNVRKLNGPDTFICCTVGPMEHYLYHHIKEAVDEIKAETGDQKIVSFPYIPINVMMEGYGAAGHPSAKTHARMGRELAAYIRKYVLGE